MVSANHRPHSLRGDAVVSGFMDFITRLRHHEGFHAAGPCMLMHLIQDSRILHSSLGTQLCPGSNCNRGYMWSFVVFLVQRPGGNSSEETLQSL